MRGAALGAATAGRCRGAYLLPLIVVLIRVGYDTYIVSEAYSVRRTAYGYGIHACGTYRILRLLFSPGAARRVRLLNASPFSLAATARRRGFENFQGFRFCGSRNRGCSVPSRKLFLFFVFRARGARWKIRRRLLRKTRDKRPSVEREIMSLTIIPRNFAIYQTTNSCSLGFSRLFT